MKAIILAAGLGTRLYPLTANKPKALVPVQGKPLLQHQIEKLKKLGFTKLLINIHAFGDQIIDFLDQNKNFGLDIVISDERKDLLDTGGALNKARNFISGNEAVLIHNVDVLTNLDIRAMQNEHLLSDSIATLAIRNRETSRYLIFDNANRLKAWGNIKTGEKKGDWSSRHKIKAAFSGVHIISPEIVDFFPAQEKFSIIDFYLSISEKQRVGGYFHDDSEWLDVGKPDTIQLAENLKFLG
ncbi:MAG: nucleotidyltransferase family protein [Bacteroidales bacterium]|nr:nucleotidyltransferase family protein [Bacteroidales bacterium]